MGKKVHNAKARQNPQTIIDNTELKNLKVELDIAGTDAGYDEANALVLPSKKRATKINVEKKQNVRLLTKKQRKHLQSVVDKKKKKEERASILAALANVQVPEAELQQYTSISQAQTVGVKKLQTLDSLMAKKQKRDEQQQQADAGTGRISGIKGAGKRRLLIEEEEELEAKRKNPNIVGLEEDSEDGDSEDEEDEEEEEEQDVAEKNDDKEDREEQVEKSEEISKVEKAPLAINETEKPVTSSTSTKPLRQTVYVPVHRSADIQAARLKLPILAEEQSIMETINEHDIVIVAGETGSGKTTQIPQFLYEAGYAENNKLIGVTEPRRVAAIAMSKRVAHEMNLSEREVSYLIRFEGNVTPETRIKFMTDGVLLKEIESDFLLKRYAVVILDEAHERSAYTDILIGLLSRIVPLREKRGSPLKLIIMSATLRVEDFTSNTRLFRLPPPVLKVEARQFPVTVHFQKRTPDNYVDEAYRKVVKIHSKLPEGGVLIFLTGQQEVNNLVRKLRRAFPYTPVAKPRTEEKTSPEKDQNSISVEDADDDDEFDMKRAIKQVKKSKKKFLTQISLPKINLDDYKLPGDDTEADLHEVDDEDNGSAQLSNDEDEDDDDLDDISATTTTKQPLWVLPLYSLLSTEKQNRIFQPPPEGCRLCVVSTNVAETSLTIPHIKYVVDSGRQKTRLYDKLTGVSAFVVTYTSKASADQRAGRAGRISAGHCYRLYSSAVYNDEFVDFAVPDIQQKPVDDLMLQMRCMGIDRVINFPFPSPPDTVQLQAAEERLIILGALKRLPPSKESTKKDLPPVVTPLGRVISRFPVAPRFGKMLALSHQQDLLPYTVCLVAALSVQELLIEVPPDRADEDAAQQNRWQRKRLAWAGTGNYQLLGDPMVLLRAVGAAEYAGSQGKLVEFCTLHGLRHKAITEVRKLRVQLTNDINLYVDGVDLSVDPGMAPPSDAQARFLRQIMLAGMGDHVAKKLDLSEVGDKEEKRRLKYAYHCQDIEEPAHMHGSSVLRRQQQKELPEWVIYQEAFETRHGEGTKMFIRGITAIEPEWLLLYVPGLCNIRAVLEDPSPRYKAADGKVYAHVQATFGKAGWMLPLTEMEMPLNELACSYFGLFLLDGQVCPKLARFKAKLKSTPSALVKSWSNLNETIMRFKRALSMRGINTRTKLYEEWEKNKDFLLDEYQNMLYDVSLSELTGLWPPIEKEID